VWPSTPPRSLHRLTAYHTVQAPRPVHPSCGPSPGAPQCAAAICRKGRLRTHLWQQFRHHPPGQPPFVPVRRVPSVSRPHSPPLRMPHSPPPHEGSLPGLDPHWPAHCLRVVWRQHHHRNTGRMAHLPGDFNLCHRRQGDPRRDLLTAGRAPHHGPPLTGLGRITRRATPGPPSIFRIVLGSRDRRRPGCPLFSKFSPPFVCIGSCRGPLWPSCLCPPAPPGPLVSSLNTPPYSMAAATGWRPVQPLVSILPTPGQRSP
jgi:hypothetical protein